MSTRAQKEAVKGNIKKAQAKWREMPAGEHAKAQPEGRARAKPGTKGRGNYYRIVVRPKEDFVAFRYHDVGAPGHVKRLAGKRASGSWADQAWLISKEDAHVEEGSLVADTSDAREILDVLGSVKHMKGDTFKGHPRKNVPERKKPTPSQRSAQSANIRKAQEARRSS